MTVVLRVLALVSLIYYGIIVAYAGFKASFSPFWLLLASGSFFLSFLVPAFSNLPKAIQYPLLIIILLVSLLFVAVEGMVIYEAGKPPVQKAQYMIILGARVKGSVPSKTLNERILAATQYLLENKETIVIVSGGQGPGEDITEAEAMGRALLSNGIDKNRIIYEDQSVNTVENIKFSKDKIPDHSAKVVISTSDFHMYRGIHIAKKQGLNNVSGCPSKPDRILTLNYYIREFFALAKDKIKGNF